MVSDSEQLLRCYADEGSEEAFGQLVSRHIHLVYSTALRRVGGDAHLAEDVAQTVFTDLARKACGLSRGVILGGWLYRHTCFCAAKAVRGERRRQARETEASRMNTINEADPAWQDMAPVLDEAMNGLSAGDRDVLVLRFFEGRDLRALGAALGASPDAAQKRVARALERLRAAFARRGVTPSASALAAALAAQAVHTAPAGLAASVSSASLAGATGGTAWSLFHIMTLTQLKTLAAAVVIAAGVAIPVVVQQQKLARLRTENLSLRQQIEQAAADTADTAARPATDAAELERLRQQQSELLRLRAEVTRLRSQERELANSRAGKPRGAEGAKSIPAPGNLDIPSHLPKESWTDAGFATPQAALLTRGWAVQNADRDRFRESLFVTEGARKVMEETLEEMIRRAPNPDQARQQIREQGLGVEEGMLFPMMAQNRDRNYTGYRILSQESPAADTTILEVETEMAAAPSRKETMRLQRIGSDWKVVIDEEFIQAQLRGGKKQPSRSPPGNTD